VSTKFPCAAVGREGSRKPLVSSQKREEGPRPRQLGGEFPRKRGRGKSTGNKADYLTLINKGRG